MLTKNLQSAYLRLAKADVTPTALRLLLVMLGNARENGMVHMSKSDLAQAVEVNERTIFTAMQDLVSKRFVAEIIETPGVQNWYKLHPTIVDACLSIGINEPDGGNDGGRPEDRFTFVVTGKESPKSVMAPQGTQDHSIQTQDHSIQTQDHPIRKTQDHPIQTQDHSIQPDAGHTSLCNYYNNNNISKIVTGTREENLLTGPTSTSQDASQQPPVTDWMDEQAARLRQRFEDRNRSLIICEGYKGQYMEPLLVMVARIHGQLPALEADVAMRSSNDAFTAIVTKMQQITVALWHLGIRTEDEIKRYGDLWYTEHFSGKKDNPPQGNQFVQFVTGQIHRTNAAAKKTPAAKPNTNVVVERKPFNPFNRPTTGKG